MDQTQITRRVCAYCGDANARLTREHVWPKWLQAELGEGLEAHVQALEQEVQRTWWAAPASLTVKRVCTGCNNGWMARCEARAAPVLRPLIHNATRTLSHADQHVLAFWALKTATACDLATGHPAAPAALRQELVDASNLPEGLSVLVARYAGSRHPLLAGGWVRTLDVEIGMQRLKRRFLQLTVGVGPVVFQVFGHDMTGVSHLRPAGIKRDFARVISPATGPCYWPLPMGLGDEGLRRFARDP